MKEKHSHRFNRCVVKGSEDREETRGFLKRTTVPKET